MHVMRVVSIATVAVVVTGAGSEAQGVMAQWSFEGTLADDSGNGHALTGDGRFVDGARGQALAPRSAAEVASGPDLELGPGLVIDCFVSFPARPAGYETFLIKDSEYQLRVNSPSEGGAFSFFVYCDGWEPRIGTGIVPEAGRWYHLIASWDGYGIALEVDGERFAAARPGVAAPKGNPLRIGGCGAAVDELTIRNPVLARQRALRERIDAVPAGAHVGATHFGGPDRWQGWECISGPELRFDGGAVRARLTDPAVAFANPALDVDVTEMRYVSLDLNAPGATNATLGYSTDLGEGTVVFRAWGDGRTSIVPLAGAPRWGGRLRALSLSLQSGVTGDVVVRNVWISKQPEGSPWPYIRNLSPTRAKLRVGRDEPIIATIRNLGRRATGLRARLSVPDGIRVVGEAEKPLPDMDYDATEMVEWTVRAERPAAGEVIAQVTGDGAGKPGTATDFGEVTRREASARSESVAVPGFPTRIEITPRPDLPKADYVPEPRPVVPDILTLMHYCPLWKEGTHYGWGRIEPWPERRPAIGWYDEGTPEVADWHIKYALEHGIQGFIYCWYRATLEPEITLNIGHALHDGLLHARYLDRFKFTIMWENGCAYGVKSREDLMQNLLPFWIENYFRQPSYVKIGNKPLLYVWVPGNVTRDLGGSAQVREALDAMRAACREAGFDGLYIVGCVGNAARGEIQRMAEEGWDATSAYATWAPPDPPGPVDAEGIQTMDNARGLRGQLDVLKAKADLGILPDIPTLMMGWDPRPWHGKNTSSYRAQPSPEAFRDACRDLKAMIEARPGNGLDRRVVVFDNWNEFGEGHFLEPCSGFGFGYVDAIRSVFCPDAPPCEDITPEDIGLRMPERAYAMRREILGGLVGRERRVVDGLVLSYDFEGDDPLVVRDASACEFHGLKQDYQSTAGHTGKGFLCDGGSVSVGAHRLLFPADGITVDVWVKVGRPDQSDAWIVNTVSAPTLGYRLGLIDGRLAWQVPQGPWSHLLTAPDPLPVGEWAHAMATFDNRTMRLYVNGGLVGEMDRPGPIGMSDGALCIGSFASGNRAAAFDGVLDELHIHDHGLSPDAIAART